MFDYELHRKNIRPAAVNHLSGHIAVIGLEDLFGQSEGKISTEGHRHGDRPPAD